MNKAFSFLGILKTNGYTPYPELIQLKNYMSKISDFNPEALIKRLDKQQEDLATRIGSGHRLLSGVAGSGKTLILLTHARILVQQHPDYKILILCYNICLSSYIKSILKEDKSFAESTRIQVSHFHEWAAEVLQSRYSTIRNRLGHKLTLELGRVPTSLEIDERCEDFLGEQLLFKLQKFPLEAKWDAILIDEGHTFYPNWFKSCVSALKKPDTDHLLIVSDANQKIYNRPKFTWSSVGIKAQGRTYGKDFNLDQNYRNTQEILSAAWSIIQPLTIEKATDNDTFPCIQPKAYLRQGLSPMLEIADSPIQEVELVINKIKELQKSGYQLEDIAILYKAITKDEKESFSILRKKLNESRINNFWITESNHTKRRYGINTSGVRILTTLSSLGLEFKVVIIVWLQQFNGCLSDSYDISAIARRQLYVAMTRAQNELYLYGSGNSSFLTYISNLKTIKLSKTLIIEDSLLDLNILKISQSNFQQRLKIGQLIICEAEGYHKEIIEIKNKSELELISKYSWQKVDDYKLINHSLSAKEIYENNMKGKLGELALKKYLGNLITSIDFSNREYGDGGFDFALTSNCNICIQVKARCHKDIDKVDWKITQKEIDVNAALVCIYIPNKIDESKNKYTLIYAGFRPTKDIELKGEATFLKIDDLLYIGGLQKYLRLIG
ncbi:DEAD/DEAH box helicase [Nostoc sp. UHCC 0252]|uniref:DEAD/DEAH box helicase n=1 Tax=Nostoc sp. UHCC 0252 TaxID=3110241 RepID=UPI002B1E983A|nr:3'-5' exonuclease [Nostoc sp. UHCC 0252]MEA5603794.1 3'-5' exonuclease [Nostoc sp. UHCC 0252]